MITYFKNNLFLLFAVAINMRISIIFGQPVDNSRFKVYRVMGNSIEGVEALEKLYDAGSMDFWQKPTLNTNVDIMVDIQQESRLLKLIKDKEIPYSIIVNNVESKIPTMSKLNRDKGGEESNRFQLNEYNYPETIFDWMDNLGKTYSDICKVHIIGQSVQGNPLKLIKISTGKYPKKRAVFIDATIHGREWITTAVASYIINDLVTNSSKNKELLDSFNFFILPIVNPDGYNHSCYHNRLWRKSRRSSDYLLADLVGCLGVDLNRNFGYEWGGPGSGTILCSESYRGLAPFSEPETAAIRDFVLELKEVKKVNWTAYFSLHSFGQTWLTPWGYTQELPDDYNELMRVAEIGAKALSNVHGTNYTVGSSSELLYLAAGGSDDWFKGIVGCKYSYTLELRDTGIHGFTLPYWQILPTAEETWTGIIAALKAIPL